MTAAARAESNLFTEESMQTIEQNGALVAHKSDGEQLMSIIERAALSPDFEVSKLQGLLDLKREWDKDRAAEAYGAAITKFQHICPTVHKGRTATITGDKGSYKYGFASYDDVMRQAGPSISECGIGLGFSTARTEHGIRVTCRVRVGIHYEDHTLDVPVPQMKVNDTQRYGAALSYAKRYALCAALNIVTTDEDDDASSCYDPINREQEVAIAEFIEQHEIDKAAVLSWRKVERITDIAAKDFDEVMRGLRAKANAKARA